MTRRRIDNNILIEIKLISLRLALQLQLEVTSTSITRFISHKCFFLNNRNLKTLETFKIEIKRYKLVWEYE